MSECVWRPGNGFEFEGRLIEYGSGTVCEGEVEVGDPFVREGIFELEEGEEENAFCERHCRERGEDI